MTAGNATTAILPYKAMASIDALWNTPSPAHALVSNIRDRPPSDHWRYESCLIENPS
jgi:hypothetical protein